MTIHYINRIAVGQKIASLRTASFLEALKAALGNAAKDEENKEHVAVVAASMKERNFSQESVGLLAVKTKVTIRNSDKQDCSLERFVEQVLWKNILQPSLDQLLSVTEQPENDGRRIEVSLPSDEPCLEIAGDNWAVTIESSASFEVQKNVQLISSPDEWDESSESFRKKTYAHWIGEFWSDAQQKVLQRSVDGIVSRFLSQVEPKVLFMDEINEMLPLSMEKLQPLIEQYEANRLPWYQTIRTNLPDVEWRRRDFNLMLQSEYQFTVDRIKTELIASAADSNGVVESETVLPSLAVNLHNQILEQLTWLLPGLEEGRSGGGAIIRFAGLVAADGQYKHINVRAEIVSMISTFINVYVDLDRILGTCGMDSGWTGSFDRLVEMLAGKHVVLHTYSDDASVLQPLQPLVANAKWVEVHQIQDPEIGEWIALGPDDILIHGVKQSAEGAQVAVQVRSTGNARSQLKALAR